jgi:HNH endonuclease
VTGIRAKSAKKQGTPVERKKVPINIRTQILTEAGYRCAVPTCRELLLLQLHHIYQVSEKGKDEASNLIALCPTCHAYYHAGHISREAIFAYKSILVAVNRAFDIEAIDRLMFLDPLKKDFLIVSGDGVLHFDRLIAAGLASFSPKSNNNGLLVTYAVNLSVKGKMLIEAWKSGDHLKIQQAVAGTVPAPASGKQSPQAKR